MKRFIISFIIFFTFIHITHAQNDLGSSITIEASKKIFNNISISLEEDFRTRDNFSTIDRLSTSIDLSYKPWKFFKIGAIYNPIIRNHEKKGWELRHRYYFYLSGSYSVKNFTFTLRERYQSTYRVGIEKTSKRANPKNYICSRIKLEYAIKKIGLEPYISFEFFASLNNPVENSIDKLRYLIGTTYKINKKHSIDLFYRYTTETEDDEIIKINMIGLGYSIKF